MNDLFKYNFRGQESQQCYYACIHTHTHTHMNKVYAHLKLDILPTVDVELYNVLGKKLTKFMKPNILNHEQVKVCF